jgi:hypothetical protein
MSKLRAVSAHTPAIVISTIALVLSLGGGAYAATALGGSHAAKSTPAALSFHRLKLINGWKSAANTAGAGTPSYTVSNGILYLYGGIYQPIQGKAAFAYLPKGFRPAVNVFITVSVAEGVTNFGTLYISPKGEMEVYDPSNANTPVADFTDLTGVSFPLGS